MKKRICLFLLAFCLLLTACGPAAQPETDADPAPEVSTPEGTLSEPSSVPEDPAEPELSQREKGWLEDIEFLREKYKEKHADPFYFCPEEEFDWKLDRLSAQVGALSDSDIFFELSAIVAGMGDDHSLLQWDDPFDRVFPVRAGLIDGRLYLTGYLEGYEQFAPYLLHEIVAVNGVDALYLRQKSASLLVPFTWGSREIFYFYPAFFDWAGCDYKEGYVFQILNDKQEVESVEVPVIGADECPEGIWVRHRNWESLLYLKKAACTEYYEGNDGGCIQWCIADMEHPSTVRRYLHEAHKLMEEHPDCGKLAIDLRGCPGGLADSLEEFQKGADLLEGKRIYVLTSGYTASAATRIIAYCKDAFGAVSVGEPAGQFSSFFSRSEDVCHHPAVFPHSQIKAYISDLWRDSAVLLPEMGISPVYEEYYNGDGRLYEWETCIQPDVFVHMDIEDLRQGKDSVLEWVLAQ